MRGLVFSTLTFLSLNSNILADEVWKADTEISLRQVCDSDETEDLQISLGDASNQVGSLSVPSLALRESPNKDSKIIASISMKEFLSYQGIQEGSFLKVNYDGRQGWVNARSEQGKSTLCYAKYVTRRICPNYKATIFTAPGQEFIRNDEVQFLANENVRYYGRVSKSFDGKYAYISYGRDQGSSFEAWISSYNLCNIPDELDDFERPTINLEAPYYSQRANRYNPIGTCGITSLAMALGTPEIGIRYSPDELFLKFDYNEVKTPEGMARWGRNLGAVDSYGTKRARMNDLFKALDQGYPAIVFGYFTGSGHIILVKGYDKQRQEFIVHDPYGDWNEVSIGGSGGYPSKNSRYVANTRTDGKNRRYRYENFRRAASPDGLLWMTVIK